MPRREPSRTVALAALLSAASHCAASPGHTAQPFQPTRTARRFVEEAWRKDIKKYVQQSLRQLASRHAKVKGHVMVADANMMAKKLVEGDLAFIDPPYSGVQYSRFYHVLETIANGDSVKVSGIGRYPDRSCRPQSRYSLKAHSLVALQEMLNIIARKKAVAILTFPDHDCSNGLSGKIIESMSSSIFNVKSMAVDSKFSTLGGSERMVKQGRGRGARQTARELIFLLEPKGD